MAYTQKPGRGNGPKTGKDIPTPFMQIDPNAKKNPKTGEHVGYNAKTSELPNTVNKGGYEKTLDKGGNTLYLRGGDKKVISQAQVGTKQEADLRAKFNAEKSDTDLRRKKNLDFLESRQKTGQSTK